MPIYSILSGIDIKIMLFAYEQQLVRNDRHDQQLFREVLMEVLDEDHRAFITTEGEYIIWELAKRKLFESEIISNTWLITSDNQKSFVLNFQPDHLLTVGGLFGRKHFDGYWSLEHGILSVVFKYHQRNYDINIIGNNYGLIHSALQIVDNDKADILKFSPMSNV